jgi:hypothetical protein
MINLPICGTFTAVRVLLDRPHGARHPAFTDLRAWQACDVYKRAVYRMCAEGPIANDWARRRQLEEFVAGPPAHLAEGFGRFEPRT